ncbi:MAG TPA: glycoside hydrolase family 2 TIM barrel-domain containing protein [Solirubrobacteraceae bacterium]|nr:glycoside hydrolase family 2 TIM barrel-domain containing protein [Solirubrobacteraceae bacterium]
MRLLCALAAVVALALVLPHAASAADPPGPVMLAQGWNFAPDPGDDGLTDNWQGGDRGEAWEPVTVPHVADASADPDKFWGSVGWYRIRFTGPATAAGLGWALRFEQVRRVARVWLNGRELTQHKRHRDPYTPFELPASGLRAGAPNTLVVRVDYHRDPRLREGWWNWGGITRQVSLVARGPIVMHDAGMLPRRVCVESECAWNVLVDGWLENRSEGVQQPAVTARLQSPDGAVSEGTVTPRALRPGERVRVRFSVSIEGDVKTWSPEHPDRYASTIATRTGGQVVQVDHRHIGLRRVDISEGMLRLNGRPLDLRGASIQEDIPGRGPAMTDADIENTVDELKALGVNVTRAHYLLDPRLLERFDEEGILVWSQAPVYHRDDLLRTPGQRSYELAVVRATILAARNHPSVITHSVANELTTKPDEQRYSQVWMTNAAQLARDLDPTLPVSQDILSYPNIPRQATYDAYDMLGINSYYGWYEGKADRDMSTADIDDLAPYLRAMRDKYPGKALVITEFGAEASEPGPADVKQTYAFQTQYLKRNLDIIDRLGFMGGAIYWTAREFAVKPYWDGGAGIPLSKRDSFHRKGLISYDGKIKPAFNAAKDAFEATPLYRDDPAAVARAELSGGGSFVMRALLFLGVFGFIAALIALDAWCLRDIWRAWRPRGEGQVVELPTRRVA